MSAEKHHNGLNIPEAFQGLIFDLDGVITKTAKVHAKAWKKMIDQFLEEYEKNEGKEYQPLDISTDYPKYIDGIPRYDGVREFLKSRDINIPEGEPSDSPDKNTIHGLGNRKNDMFKETLQESDVEVYEDTVKMLKKWRSQGMKTAVISSSKNCKPVLEAVNLLQMFDVRVDGVVSEEIGLAGKPEPDIFLEAAKRLELHPEECVVFEDAIAGVSAASRGSIGLTVGVVRNDSGDTLLENGADIVTSNLEELETSRA